jgi:hypothetical protein
VTGNSLYQVTWRWTTNFHCSNWTQMPVKCLKFKRTRVKNMCEGASFHSRLFSMMLQHLWQANMPTCLHLQGELLRSSSQHDVINQSKNTSLDMRRWKLKNILYEDVFNTKKMWRTQPYWSHCLHVYTGHL